MEHEWKNICYFFSSFHSHLFHIPKQVVREFYFLKKSVREVKSLELAFNNKPSIMLKENVKTTINFIIKKIIN